jgi:hypothetical protein
MKYNGWDGVDGGKNGTKGTVPPVPLAVAGETPPVPLLLISGGCAILSVIPAAFCAPVNPRRSFRMYK